MSNFDVDLTLISWRCFDVEIRLSFHVDIKILIFKAWWYENKNFFSSQPKIDVVSTLNFIDESTLTNGRWINVDITLTDIATLFQHISMLNQRWVFSGFCFNLIGTLILKSRISKTTQIVQYKRKKMWVSCNRMS